MDRNSIKTAQIIADAFERSASIVRSLIAGQTKAYVSLYPTLTKVLQHFSATSNPTLVHYPLITPEQLLSELFIKGKLTEEKLSGVEDIDKWIYTVAKNLIISILRPKSVQKMIKNTRSYDAKLSDDDSRPFLDKIVRECDDEPTAEDKLRAIECRFQEMNLSNEYTVVYYGRREGKTMEEIVEEYASAVRGSGRTFDSNKRYRDNCYICQSRGHKRIREFITVSGYKEIASSL